jgi:ferredoxin
MRVVADQGACIGCELCAETYRARVAESADICPVEAIAIGPQDGSV